MDQYLAILLLLVLSVVFALGSFATNKLVAKTVYTDAKYAAYECGIVPTRLAPERFPVRFYLVAMLFIMFDIEIIFLYPWAVQSRELGLFGLLDIVFFTSVLFATFLYALAKGGLEWGPIKRGNREQAAVSASRTANSTVRRVGLDGRYVTQDLLEA